jgi:TATA-box binding protein (TBP) (component of TFIID and TFIIIB)
MDDPLSTLINGMNALATRPLAVTSTALTSRAGWAQMDDESRFRRCMESIKTTNFVATGALDVPYVNVAAIAQQWPGANFHMITFAAVIIRLVHPHTTCSIYPTGTMACMGAKTEAEAALALHKIVRILNKLGLKCRLQSMKIDNVVASVLSFPINLRKLHQKWGHVVKYADNFPGATMNCAGLGLDPPTKIVAEIFKSGKVNLTGAQNKAEIQRVCPVILHILEDVQIRPEDVDVSEVDEPFLPDMPIPGRGGAPRRGCRRRRSDDDEDDDILDAVNDYFDEDDPDWDDGASDDSNDYIPPEYNQNFVEMQQLDMLLQSHNLYEQYENELDMINDTQNTRY